MNLMVVGAGDAGAAVIKETRLSKESIRKVCCIIDREPSKWGKTAAGRSDCGRCVRDSRGSGGNIRFRRF